MRVPLPCVGWLVLGGWLLGLWVAAGATAAERQVIRGFYPEPEPESADARAFRHQAVALRRAGPVVIAHRGASAFAPENSFEAYAAAMDYGADGVEIDLRRTRDGALVAFHDDAVDRLTEGFGWFRALTYREVQALPPRRVGGRVQFALPPTFAALLDLARQRAMLLHLDLKEPGLEPEVARLLDASDAWDHIVAINSTHAATLLKDPRLRLLRYKVPGLYADRGDLDPETIRRALSQPGDMLLVDDPRVAAMVLERPARTPRPVTKSYRLVLGHLDALGVGSEGPTNSSFRPLAYLQALAARISPTATSDLLALLGPDSTPRHLNLATNEPSSARIVERAWAARQLGRLGQRNGPIIRALERLVEQASPSDEPAYDGLDGAAAIRALAELGSLRSLPKITAWLRENQPRAGTSLPITSWGESRMCYEGFLALGEMRSGGVKRFLKAYLRSRPGPAGPAIPEYSAEASRALMQQRLAWDEIAELLRSSNPVVRGTVLLECLDRPNEERGLALRAAAPWALKLPRATELTLPNRGRLADRAGLSVTDR